MSIHHQTIHINNLTTHDKANLLRQLYKLSKSIFTNYPKKHLANVFKKPSEDCVLDLYLDNNNIINGFSFIRKHTVTINDKKYNVLCIGPQGLIPHRRSAALMRFYILFHFLKYKLVHFGQYSYGFFISIHPTSYLALSRTIADYWPRHNCETPADIKTLTDSIVDALISDNRHPNGIIKSDRISKDEDFQNWFKQTEADIQFYCKLNPHFMNGDGLPVLFPATLKNVYSAVVSIIFKKIKLLFQKRVR